MGIEDHITSGSSFCGLDADNRTNVANKVFCWYVPGPNLSPIANMLFSTCPHMDVTAKDV